MTRSKIENIRTRLRAGGQDRREAEHLADRRMGEDVGAVLVGFDVVDELEEPDLVVNHKEDCIVLVEALVFESFGVDFQSAVMLKSIRDAY